MSSEQMDAFERSLIASTEDDAPSEEARAKALQALLVASAAGTGVALTALSSGAAATTAASSAKAAPLAVAAIVKWAIVASVGTAAVVAGVAAMPSRDPRPMASVSTASATPSARRGPAPTGPARPQDTRIPAEDDEPAIVRVEDLRRAPARASEPAQSEPVPAPRREPAPAPSSPVDTLTNEVAMLDAARAALRAGDAALALVRLDAYDASFARGETSATMTEEAAVLRIDATRRSGDETKARALAVRFLETHSTSPYAARVRGTLSKEVP